MGKKKRLDVFRYLHYLLIVDQLLKAKKGFLFLVLLTLLPILIFSVTNVVLETRKKASEEVLPFRIEIAYYGCSPYRESPQPLTSLKIGDHCSFSALVYDSQHQPFFEGFDYFWYVSSTGSLIDLSHTEGPVTDLLAKQKGTGDLFVVAKPKSPGILIAPITASLPIKVGGSHPVDWQTGTVRFTAEEFWVEINGKKHFLPQDLASSVHSDPGDSRYTTLEVTWNEWIESDTGAQLSEMRFFVYFKSDGQKWWSEEIRTYDGELQGEWIYYRGRFFEHNWGQAYQAADFTVQSVSAERPGFIGKIYLVNPRIEILKTGDCLPGDLNCDRRVDISDLVLVGSCFGTSDRRGDANEDGVVNVSDLVLVGSHFGEGA